MTTSNSNPNKTPLAADFNEVRDVTVIGAGPVGLSAAFWCGMRSASVRIIDSLAAIGGQCAALYPEKLIFDVPGHPAIPAVQLVENLRRQALEPFDVPVHLDTTAHAISYTDEHVVLHTDRGDLRSRTVVLAGGHGAFEPKKLPMSDVDLAPWEGRGVKYLVTDKGNLAGKRVVIVGGGDSALDWVVNLDGTAAGLTLVHRRDAFRAHEATFADVQRLAETGRVDVKTPYVIREVLGNGHLEGVRLARPDGEDGVVVPCDSVLLQLGFLTKLGPLKQWGFELAKGAVVVDRAQKTSLDRVWACGDIATFDGKLKLIATGFAEAAIAVANAVQYVRPEMKLQPAYSSNTGVPIAA